MPDQTPDRIIVPRTDQPRNVVINPYVSFGKPVIAGTGLPTRVVAERFKAGDTIPQIVANYGRKEEEIKTRSDTSSESLSLYTFFRFSGFAQKVIFYHRRGFAARCEARLSLAVESLLGAWAMPLVRPLARKLWAKPRTAGIARC